MRKYLSANHLIHTLIDFGYEKIFSEATNYSCIVLLCKSPSNKLNFIQAKQDLVTINSFAVSWNDIGDDTWHFDQNKVKSVFTKIETVGVPLAELTQRFGTGVQSGADKVLTLDAEAASKAKIEKQLLRSVFRGRDVRRYNVASETKSLVFPYSDKGDDFVILEEDLLRSRYPKAFAYLNENKKRLQERIWFGKDATQLSGYWYGMMYLDSRAAFTAPHLLTPSLSNKSNFAVGNEMLFATGTAGVTSVIPKDIKESILYLLGVLNSNLLSFYAIRHSPVFQGAYYKFSAPYLKKLPIRRINFSDAVDSAAHDKMVQLVEQMLNLHKRLHAAKTETDKELYQRQIDATDKQIDALVYELYGLTDEEIKIVEGK